MNIYIHNYIYVCELRMTFDVGGQVEQWRHREGGTGSTRHGTARLEDVYPGTELLRSGGGGTRVGRDCGPVLDCTFWLLIDQM